mgnify:CR=1 FL=1
MSVFEVGQFGVGSQARQTHTATNGTPHLSCSATEQHALLQRKPPHQHCREEDVREGELEEHFPAEGHELVKAEAGQGPADDDEEDDVDADNDDVEQDPDQEEDPTENDGSIVASDYFHKILEQSSQNKDYIHSVSVEAKESLIV